MKHERLTDIGITTLINALATSLVELFGEGWSVKAYTTEWANPNCADIKGPDGVGYHITAQREPRIEISGYIPRHSDGSWPLGYKPDHIKALKTQIFVSTAKTPQQIAAEIKRRLEPDYLQVLTYAKQQIAGQDDYQSSVNSVVKQLAAAFCVTLKPNRNNTESFSSYGGGSPSVDVQCSNNSANLKVNSCPVDLALDIARLIQQHRERVAKAQKHYQSVYEHAAGISDSKPGDS